MIWPSRDHHPPANRCAGILVTIAPRDHSPHVPEAADSSSDRLLAESAFVHRLARALVRDADLAHDVAQDTLLAAQQQPAAPRDLRDWLAAVARRLATQSRLARSRRTRHELAAAKPPAGHHEARTVERLRLHQRLTAAVLELPEPYRTAVTLRYLDERPPRAIAQQLQTTSELVRQRVHRGLELLRSRLDGEYGDRSTWAGAFVAAGFGSTSLLPFLFPILLMNKFAVVAATVLVAGAFCLWPSPATVPPQLATDVATAATPAPVATASAGMPDRIDVPTRMAVPEADSAACVLVVVDEQGAPVPQAECHTYATGSELVVEGITDTLGRCRLPAASGRGGVVVRAAGHAPHWTELAERRGQHRIELPDGAVVRGTLWVDGQPGEGFEMWLSGPQQQPPVPRALVAAFQDWRLARVRTAADGSFCCRGLPTNWRGRLRLPMALLLLPASGGSWENDDSVALSAGPEEVTILTTRLPGPRLRIVWQDTSAPAANAEVTAYADFVDDTSSPVVSTSADRHGLCRLGFKDSRPSTYLAWCQPDGRPALAKVNVSVRAPGSAGSVKRTLGGKDLQTDAETVIHLPRAKTTHFLAVDPHGRPVPGARVQAQGISEPTGADGRGCFAGEAKDVRAIGAPGHQVRPFTARALAAGTAEAPLVVELPAANSLTLRFVDGNGLPIKVGRAAVRSDTWFFAGGRHACDLDRLLYGQATDGHWTPGENADGSQRVTDYHLALGPVDGTATLHSLEPGMVCTVIVHDSLGEPIATQAVTTPAAGAHEAVEVRVLGMPLDVRCEVVGPDGKSIVGATVAVSAADRDGTAMQPADDGSFRLTGICRTATVTLIARAAGHVERRLEGIAAAGQRPEPIVLERGHTVTVRIVDEHEEALPLRPFVVGPRAHSAYDDLAVGERRFRDLPGTVVTFACSLGGKRFSIDHDPRQGDAVLRVPRPGMLRFACASAWPTTAGTTCLVAIVRRLDAEDPPSERAQPDHDGPPLSLVPGRYRVTLCERTLHDDGSGDSDRDLGRSTEVTVVAGATTTAVLP